MPHRKLLVLTYHFPPSAASGAFRMLGFVQHLPRFDWQSVVVAPPRLPWEPTDEALLGRVPPETAVHHVPYPDGLIWKPMRRLFHERVWLPSAAAACYRAIRRHQPDAVLTSGPPHSIHLLGRHLRRWTGLPWVADFRDPWVAGDPSQTRRKVPWREARAELSVMHEAEAIVANTPRACDLLCHAYPQFASKMSSITNGYDPEPFEPNPVPPLTGSTIEIIHTGTIYANRSPGPFLEAIQRLEPASVAGKRLRVRFIGDFLDEQKKQEIQDNVHVFMNTSVSLEEQMPYSEAIRATVQADLLLLMDTPGRQAGVPAKLYEYIGAGRPILALAELDSDVAWVLNESGVPHRIASPLNAEAIRRALTELLQDPATARCGGHDKPLQSRFTRKHLAGELAALLDSCLDAVCFKLDERSVSEAAR
ncbi:MAG: glycosyltransferase family 4 protein [Isosphaerales bacterium]